MIRLAQPKRSTNEQLVARYRRTQEPRVIARVLKRSKHRIVTILSRYVRPGELDDMVQDVFVRLLSGLNTFDATKASFRTWSGSVARNVARDYVKYLSRRTGHLRYSCESSECRSLREPGGMPMGRTTTKASSDFVNPRELASLRETTNAVRRMVERLPEKDREIVYLVYFDGNSFTEAAEFLGMPVGSVKTCAFRSFKFIRNRLRDTELYTRDRSPRAGVTAKAQRR